MSDPASSAERYDPAIQPSSYDKDARAAQAVRIEAMLDRWKTEDCSDEPDWDVEEIVPLRLGVPGASVQHQGGKR